MSVLALARAEIRALTPYSSARMEASGGQVLLNANESPWAPAAELELNRYPDPQPPRLRAALAALYGVEPAQLLMGRGSDEAIDLLLRAFCRAGEDAILISPPTFGMYAVAAAVQGAAVLKAPLDAQFGLDAAALRAQLTPAVKLVFVCTPNNPSGALVPLALIDELAAELAGRALLVVDEAYLEFAGAPSAATLLARHENLVVLRTLSKAHALAGARVGVLLAGAEIVELLRRIMPPYPLPTASVDAALAVLQPAALAQTRERIAVVLQQRELLRAALSALPAVREVLPSAANFLCVRWRDAAGTYARLLAAGIVVRDVTRYPGLHDCLRISVGTPQENQQLLALLRGMAEAA
ncbi:histidinol-phosphate transaminase [Tahibacter harae]|uniref:Histidinol-phosphate aminotransferase n=1 Tax=Tahibacter harae TaxID=2963937 RepID=A0ABT1QSW8_9GAMM|nr:histidinol-phosphate transaminase [Tahibacter harae]MCQ4165397.1 histidinol-phosphate transaminase [Tahibacter harae]